MLKGNSVKRYDRSIPNVFFENEMTEIQLGGLFFVTRDIHYYMGLVFLRLGFEPEDDILFCNYNKDDNSFDCVLNSKEVYKINVDKDRNQINVRKHNIIYTYQCEPLECSEVGMKISLGGYTFEYADGMIFSRILSRKNAKFIVSMEGYVLELSLDKPSSINLSLYDDNGNYAKYQLDNEEDLIKQLTSLKNFGSLITSIYESLSIDDVSKYPMFSLKRFRQNEDGSLELLDLINLSNGEMQKIIMTVYDRTVSLDNEDNWSYRMPPEGTVPVDFSISMQDGRISCIFSSMEDYNLNDIYVGIPLKEDIDIALKEVKNTKKLVRKMFNNQRGDNNVF